jgi:anti-sigma factor RsiW
MNDDLINILSSGNKDIDNQKLMDYLSGKLTEQEKHEVERLIGENPFVEDAMEGLHSIGDKAKLQAYVDQLRKELQQHLEQKNQRREKHRLPEYSWIYLTIALILLICIIGYLIAGKFIH